MDEEYIIIKFPKIEREGYIEMEDLKVDVKLESILEVSDIKVNPVDPRPVDPRPVEPRPVDPRPVEPEEVNGLVLLSVSNLTAYQKQIALIVYDSIKHAIHDYMGNDSINNIIKITMMLGKMIQYIEKIKIKDTIPTGNDKKAVVIELGRILIKEMTSNIELLELYNLVAETTLETMINVSKVVNVAIVSKCCAFF